MTEPIIRGLTLTHPWPLAFLHLGKPLENRSRRPEAMGGKIGMRLAIHGGAVPKPGKNKPYRGFEDDWAWIVDGPRHKERLTAPVFRWLSAQCTVKEGNIYSLPTDFFFRPGIVAVATLAGVTRDSPSPWAAAGQYQWLLTDITPLAVPVVDTGFHQGLWTLQPEALAQVEAQLEGQ